jgi:hypothetical protein
MALNRVMIDNRGTALECDACGYEALRVAELVSQDGVALGRAMVCTFCQAAHRDRGEPIAVSARPQVIGAE